MEVSYRRRPYKISYCGRLFKGIVAANLSELKEKSLESLQIEESLDDVDVFLAEDETLVDDQDYFATIPENTKLLIKKATESTGLDLVDGPARHEVSESQEFSNQSTTTIPNDIILKIKQLGSANSLMGVLSMSNNELDILSSMSLDVFVKELGFDLDISRIFLDTVVKELTRRNDLEDATNLLKLYDRAKSSMVEGGKRKKI